jgi:hypothetical protein
LPIYENTLIWPWPGNPEYEFRDISYSDAGLAIYHGWLPLYSLAGSFAVYGIRPASSNTSLRVNYTPAEARRMTRVARLPAVFFGLVLLLAVFAAGNAFYGPDAAWIALVTVAVHRSAIAFSTQARYYSATVTLSMICCLMVWLIVIKGRWRDYILGAVSFVLLFHTHLLSFLAACIVLALTTMPGLFKGRMEIRKLAAFGSIVGAGTIPWLLVTGFLRQQNRIPRGWTLLSVPGDLPRFLPARPSAILVALAFIAFLCWLSWRGQSVSSRVKTPLLMTIRPAIFLMLWAGVGYLVFLLGMPAASYFPGRINLSFWGAELVLGSIICASMVRIFVARITVWSVAAGALTLATINGFAGLPPISQYAEKSWSNLDQLVSELQQIKLKPDTRLYATPNDHLVLTFYTGLPFQSVAPVRKAFLDAYPGDVVIVDTGEFRLGDDGLDPVDLQKAAWRNGRRLSTREAEDLSARLTTSAFRRSLSQSVTGKPAIGGETVPAFIRTEWQAYQKHAEDPFFIPMSEIMSKGFRCVNWSDWADVFFYRFVNPDSRRGANRNYLNRLRGATGYILMPSHFVIYYSPGGVRSDDAKGVDFRFVYQ